jgi:hypothetical protein
MCIPRFGAAGTLKHVSEETYLHVQVFLGILLDFGDQARSPTVWFMFI